MSELTEQDRKRLTEFLGECWHEEEVENDAQCKHCEYNVSGVEYGSDYISDYNRTFATPDDFFALKEKLVEKGWWMKFRLFTYELWINSLPISSSVYGLEIFEEWLINAPRFCWLVNEWLKEKEK